MGLRAHPCPPVDLPSRLTDNYHMRTHQAITNGLTENQAMFDDHHLSAWVSFEVINIYLNMLEQRMAETGYYGTHADRA